MFCSEAAAREETKADADEEDKGELVIVKAAQALRHASWKCNISTAATARYKMNLRAYDN